VTESMSPALENGEGGAKPTEGALSARSRVGIERVGKVIPIPRGTRGTNGAGPMQASLVNVLGLGSLYPKCRSIA